MSRMDYYKPTSLDEAWKLKKLIPGSRFIAGGTDILVKIKNREVSPPALISLRSISELTGIQSGNVTRIGAMTTISELIQHRALAVKYPVLVEAAGRLGSVQIRNVATVGGNLCNCSPCADTALPLLVLEARVLLQSPGKEREVPLNEFFVGPGESCIAAGEILTAILLDRPAPDAQATSLKKGRVKMDLAIASVAALLEMDGKNCKKARLAAGSVAPVPLRLYQVEELLENGPITKAKLAEAQKLAVKSISPITDVRSTDNYRRQIVSVYVKRCLEKLMGGNP
ncbi:MAG: xanthine dehydrogenase family protein subunit M [Candidatus Latescibacteria bacterium]|nr:xanthine dehydrogenase family protein subunit M [Candidatus Latescibacterota bacterium]NIM21730.1 xanthine dehydrogenase family protein subunit M [Candidatus Latescibacterota bacterium]NIM65868.1 xanthine dehydrogenase family protein subunit M [Candidatus Latescibacterota bacterium]NIO02613.1 xanthine dehydrogenase family protein subunit M [Candidatus Latescibacterota bacterium]NIO29594.1 xanthine dehydrogenase family protein subunit M [Candidatus Latescibacterota bacterium]